MGERRALVGVNAVKWVGQLSVGRLYGDLKNLEEQVFIIMRLKEPFIKYKGPRARMVYAPQREALPALYSPKP